MGEKTAKVQEKTVQKVKENLQVLIKTSFFFKLQKTHDCLTREMRRNLRLKPGLNI